MKTRVLLASLAAAACLATARPALAQGDSVPESPAPGAPAEDPTAWPRVFEEDGLRITLYQLQPERWVQAQLVARAAVSVETAASPEPVFGVAWLTAHTHVDKEARVVTLERFDVVRASFPTAPERTSEWTLALRKHLPGASVFDLDRLQASLAAARTNASAPRVPLKNDPPRIFFSTRPSVLVLVDGAPVERRVSGTPTLTRIVNTRALLLHDETEGLYYLGMGSRWLAAPALEGPWTLAVRTPAGAEEAKRATTSAGLPEPNELDPELSKLLDRNEAPSVFVSTRPAELIETNGEPTFTLVPGTGLLWMRNTDADVFVDTSTNLNYLLIAGRWYRAPSRSGPWAFVVPGQLPADFARIPESDPAGEVLASVPGTPQAQEAVIANTIPQTAVVDRREAKLDVTYDGEPQFAPVEGTGFAYAINTATPVIRFGFDYYACEDGVWFMSSSPAGPWAVAAVVPAAIYAIPPSCPIYYVTHCRIYEATPDYVCFGYTPGYLGCYVWNGCVVWGTGFYYRPWIGAYWYGCPWTFGFSVGVRWGFGWGLNVGFGFGARPPCRPWWGPLARPHAAFYPGAHLNFHNANVYAAWPGSVARAQHGPAAPGRAFGRNGRANNVYAAPDGHVYRHNEGTGWERREGNAWTRSSAPADAQHRQAQLESDRQAREQGRVRSENLRQPAPSAPQHYQPMAPQHPSSAPQQHSPAPGPVPPGLRGGPVRHHGR